MKIDENDLTPFYETKDKNFIVHYKILLDRFKPETPAEAESLELMKHEIVNKKAFRNAYCSIYENSISWDLCHMLVMLYNPSGAAFSLTSAHNYNPKRNDLHKDYTDYEFWAVLNILCGLKFFTLEQSVKLADYFLTHYRENLFSNMWNHIESRIIEVAE